MAETREVDPAPPRQDSSETLVAIQSWEGPLPAPETLERFEAIVPGAAKTIIEEWQAETRHRRKFEHRSLWLQFLEQMSGRLLGFLFALAALALAGYAAHIGTPWVAGVVGSGTIASVVWALVSSHRDKST
jgi:uncharacterized membrane protein